jgi:hypothetical protein
MVEIGQRRIMRDGTVVTVLKIEQVKNRYWQRHMPVAILSHPQGQISRRLPTVESYPLEDDYQSNRR